MNEHCPIKQKECPFCFLAEGKKYCGIISGTNEISKMKKCPLIKKYEKITEIKGEGE